MGDLWMLDLTRNGAATRFASEPGIVKFEFPIWSADGKQVAFRHAGAGGVTLFQKPADMSHGDAMGLVQEMGGGLSLPTSWSPDGAFVMFAYTGGPTLWDLWLAPVGVKDSKAIPFANTQFTEEEGRFSPDGQWVAYSSNESGTKETYVRRFAADGRTAANVGAGILVSKGGGSAPRWRRDGKELFYLGPNGVMMSVAVDTGTTFRAGLPTPLFQAPPNAIVGDVTADGTRFLFAQRATAPFTVVLNWMKEN
jgi:Tol biopolymer transport system component